MSKNIKIIQKSETIAKNLKKSNFFQKSESFEEKKFHGEKNK